MIDAATISRLMPHAYPFLLIDRVLEVQPGKSCHAIKNVTFNEPYFQGHFPGRPIVPGVLLLESLAQTAAIMYLAKAMEENGVDIEHLEGVVLDGEQYAQKVGYLLDIKRVKFTRVVTPGDTMHLYTTMKAAVGNMLQIEVEIRVEGESVVKGIMSVSEQDGGI